MTTFVEVLLESPDSQLDARMHPYLRKWSNPPTAAQTLEVLDYCINGALASGLVVQLLQEKYDDACLAENTTHEAVVKAAVWREKLR